MRRIVLFLIASITLVFGAIHTWGWTEIRLKCFAEVSTKDGQGISAEDVFLIVKYPHRYNFLQAQGTVSIEVKGRQFSGSVRRSYRDENHDMLFFDDKDSKGFDGSLSLISYSASIWDWQHFYDMKCDVR